MEGEDEKDEGPSRKKKGDENGIDKEIPQERAPPMMRPTETPYTQSKKTPFQKPMPTYPPQSQPIPQQTPKEPYPPQSPQVPFQRPHGAYPPQYQPTPSYRPQPVQSQYPQQMPPEQPPPGYPGAPQMASYPQPVYPPQYYPPQTYYPSMYSWEMYPYTAKELFRGRGGKKPVFTLIGALLLLSAALIYPLSGMLFYYGTQDELDLGGTMTLSGKVVDSNGDNISQARVTILNTGLMNITDSNGTFEIQNAPQGIWRVRVFVEGYKEETIKLILHQETATELIIELEEGQGTVEYNDLWILFTIAVLQVLFSFFIIAGSFYAFSQRRFAVVFVGCVLGAISTVFSLFFSFFTLVLVLGSVGFIMSTSAMIFTVTSRKDFPTSQEGSREEVFVSQSKEPQAPSQAESPGNQNTGQGHH